MTVLSEKDIRTRLDKGDLIIKPIEDYQIGPASVDFRLGNKFRVFHTSSRTHIDIMDAGKAQDCTNLVEIQDNQPFIIHPGEFVLASAKEYIKIPHDLIGILHGRSSVGRLGIQVHATSGFVEPGYFGNLTLEMSNISRIPIALYPNMRICQIIFQRLETPAGEKKNAKYSGDNEPTISKIDRDRL